jgi:hypothetical protein
MTQATGQFENNQTEFNLTGPATLWVAPWGPEPLPADTVTLGTSWGGNWITPGSTETGITWGVESKDTDIMIDEQPNPVDVVTDTQDYQFTATLTQDTLQTMLLAYGQGSIAVTAPTGGRTDATCSTTAGSPTVTDASITLADMNSTVSGAGIPAGALITSVDAGVSFVMSVPATATAASVSLTIGGTGGKQIWTGSIKKNLYSFGAEGVNAYGQPRRLYVPKGVVSGAKVDALYQRAKKQRVYATTFRAICPPAQIEIVEYY